MKNEPYTKYKVLVSFEVKSGEIVPWFDEENPIKVHPNIIYSTFCGSRMFLFSVSPLSRNL